MVKESSSTVSVLFVCLGNICRSTMAEAVFRDISRERFDIARIDSVGTGAYHAGDSPDSRTLAVLEDNGIHDYEHGARRINQSDFAQFDYILAMDRENLRELHSLQARIQRTSAKKPLREPRIALFGDFGGRKGEIVADPYYGAHDGFATAYSQMVRFSQGFLQFLDEKHVGAS